MFEPIMAGLVGLVVAVIAATHKGLTNAIQKWFERRDQEKWSVIQGLKQLRAMHDSFQEIIGIEKANRVLIFAGSNSGGVPRIDSPFYCEAIHGTYDPSICEIDPLERYGIKRKVDRFYVEMLLQLEKDGSVILEREKMPDCKLKNYYTDEEVRHSALWFIGIIDCKFLYVSVATCEETPFSKSELMRMELAVERLRSAIKER